MNFKSNGFVSPSTKSISSYRCLVRIPNLQRIKTCRITKLQHALEFKDLYTRLGQKFSVYRQDPNFHPSYKYKAIRLV